MGFPLSTVFLSYAHADLLLAQRLRTDLGALGISIWSDDAIQAGERWQEVIRNRLTEAVGVIVLITPNSLQSQWVVREWQHALTRDRQVIPVLANGVTFADLPLDLQDIQGISLDSDYEGALRSLAATLSGFAESSQPVGLPADEVQNIVSDTVDQRLAQLGLTRDRLAIFERLNGTRPSESEEPVDETLVFVVIAFDRQMDPIFEAIRSAAEAVGLRAERVMDVHGDYPITSTMLKMIRTCRLLVADLSLERPNVYFELGYARGIGKTIITTAREGTKIHFDAQDWPYIPYIDSRPLEADLLKRFRLELGQRDPG